MLTWFCSLFRVPRSRVSRVLVDDLATNVTRGKFTRITVISLLPTTISFNLSWSRVLSLPSRRLLEVHLPLCGPGLPTFSRATPNRPQRKGSHHLRATFSTKSTSNIQTYPFLTLMNPVSSIHNLAPPPPPLSTGKGICSNECPGVHSKMTQKCPKRPISQRRM